MGAENARERLLAAAEWLAYQNEDLSFGLRSASDGLELFERWTGTPGLPEFCDEQTDDAGRKLAPIRKRILGYDPLAEAGTSVKIRPAIG